MSSILGFHFCPDIRVHVLYHILQHINLVVHTPHTLHSNKTISRAQLIWKAYYIAMCVHINLCDLIQYWGWTISHAGATCLENFILQPCKVRPNKILPNYLVLLGIIQAGQGDAKRGSGEGGRLWQAGQLQDFLLKLIRFLQTDIILSQESINCQAHAGSIQNQLVPLWKLDKSINSVLAWRCRSDDEKVNLRLTLNKCNVFFAACAGCPVGDMVPNQQQNLRIARCGWSDESDPCLVVVQ
jgi:hypothetical protein